MPQSCFIIQPFDGGEYDKRYREIFLDAIKRSGFEPYRVDEDSSASIPIFEIEKKIEQADVCFADITTDNPNVWCEIGLAIAHRKDLCMVCAKGRKLPFDVQHRQVIFYTTTAPSDFDELRGAIVKRLESVTKKQSELSVIPEVIAKAEATQSDLNNFEIAVIGVLASELSFEEERISIGYLRHAIDKQGYTPIAANAGVRLLLKKRYIESSVGQDSEGDNLTLVSLTAAGWDWIEQNLERFKLKKDQSFGRVGRMSDIIDDDLPF